MGSGELVVGPGAIGRGASDVRDLGVSMLRATMFVDQYISCGFTGGLWIDDAGAQIDTISGLLDDSYGQYGRACLTAADSLDAIDKGYRTTDREQWRRFDDEMKRLNHPDSQTTTPPDVPTVEPGFGIDEFDSLLRYPGDANTELQHFLDIEDKVKQIIALGDGAPSIGKLNVPNPFEHFAEEWGGTWGQIGVSAAGMRALGTYWTRVASEAMATVGRFHGTWEGEAADSVRQWLYALADQSADHAHTMTDKGDEIFAKGVVMNDVVTPVLGIASDFFDIVNAALDLFDEVFGVLKHPLGILDAVSGSAKAFWDLIDQIFDLAKNAVRTFDLLKLAFDAIRAAIDSSDAGNVQMYPFFRPFSIPT